MLKSQIVSIAVLAVATAGAASADPFPHDNPGQQHGHWAGVYTGYNDGRNARLTIKHTETTEMVHGYDVTLEDLDRNQTFTGSGQTTFMHPHGVGHIMELTPLQEVGGSGQKNVNRLLLHTWNTDIISGSTEWNGTDYGLSFTQERENPEMNGADEAYD